MAHKFKGTDIRTPTDFSVSFEAVEGDSQTDITGTDYTDILRYKRVLKYTWSDPSNEEVANYLNMVMSAPYIDVTYPDPATNTYLTKSFKCTNLGDVPFRNIRVGAKLIESLELEFEERGDN